MCIRIECSGELPRFRLFVPFTFRFSGGELAQGSSCLLSHCLPWPAERKSFSKHQIIDFLRSAQQNKECIAPAQATVTRRDGALASFLRTWTIMTVVSRAGSSPPVRVPGISPYATVNPSCDDG